jgi:hypothetical protein
MSGEIVVGIHDVYKMVTRWWDVQVQITASSVLQPEPLRLSDRNSDLDGLRHMGAGEGE